MLFFNNPRTHYGGMDAMKGNNNKIKGKEKVLISSYHITFVRD